MTELTLRCAVGRVWRTIRQSAGMTLRAVLRIDPKPMRRTCGCLVVDRFMADHTAGVRRREMTRYAMSVERFRPTTPMRYGFRILMAFHARVLFMAHGTVCPVPLCLHAVGLASPCDGMIFRRLLLMALVTKRLQFMAHRAVLRVHLRFASMNRFPNFRCVVLNPGIRTMGRHNIRI